MLDILKPSDYDQNPQRYRKLSIVVISDTHNTHEHLSVPHGYILFHCGDFTNSSDWEHLSPGQVPRSVIKFNQWLGRLPHRYKIVICGNHEVGFRDMSKDEIQSQFLTNCICLKDESIQIEGISIYGMPWPRRHSREDRLSSIPSNIDILMTHNPPRFILDLAHQPRSSSSGEFCSNCNIVHDHYEHWGSRSLKKEIYQRIHPRVHCFGHVHERQGYTYDNNILFINAATKSSNRSFRFSFYVDLYKNYNTY